MLTPRPMVTANDLEQHRSALTGHCYRMLGSVFDAHDAVQETLVRAWKALEQFQERSAMRTWLYRIATNVCLDALDDRSRRERPMEISPAGTIHDELVSLPNSRWVEPIPDAQALPSDVDPAHLAVLRQSIRLAFVAALQHLPPKQRAALLLTEVLGWSVAEVADSLATSPAAINSALQRARATLATRDLSLAPAPLSSEQHVLLDRYVDAFERYDVDALSCLLRDDATLSMPPYSLWLQGPTSIAGWLLGRGIGCRGSRLVRVDACGSPAFAQYRQPSHGVFHPWALVVLELDRDRIAAQSFFLDTERLFPLFAMPAELRV